MKAKTYVTRFFGSIAGFWGNFWAGFFGETRAYNHIQKVEPPAVPAYLLMQQFRDSIKELHKIKELEKRPVSNSMSEPRYDDNVGKYGYPRRWPPPKKPDPPKQFRPFVTFKESLTIPVDIPGNDDYSIAIRLLLIRKPYMDNDLREVMYEYSLQADNFPCRPWIGRDERMVTFACAGDPQYGFLLCSIRETVDYTGAVSKFVLCYEIRDSIRNKRTFRTTGSGPEGVVEALRFFYSLQYYETWDEYDEFHDICPVLGIKAGDLLNQLKRDLCEAGMRLRDKGMTG